MKRSEVSMLLAKIAAVDNRRLDPPTADLNDPMSTPITDSWHEILKDLSLADCLEALLAHRRATHEWVTPSHLITGVRALRDARLAACPPDVELMAGVDPAMPGAEWVKIYRSRRTLVADGTPLRELRAIGGRTS